MNRDDKHGKVDRRKLRVDRPSLNELMPVESGGKNFEFRLEPRCKVCSKGEDVVRTVNSLLATGSTYRDVLRAIESFNTVYPESKKITYSSLRTHQKRHMPFEAFAIREIVEKRAQQYQKDFIDGEGTLIAPATYAEVMMQKAFANLSSPDTTVTPFEGLAAARALHGFTKDEEGAIDVAIAMQQLNKIISAVRAEVPPEMWNAILQRLDGEQEVVDAEIVEVEEDFDPEVDVDDRDTLE